MNEDAIRFTTIFQALVLAFLACWLLVIGKSLILPIFAAIIAVYVLLMAADALGRLPLLDRLPSSVRRILVVIAFTLSLVSFGLVVSVTADELITAAPTYKANLEKVATQFAGFVGLESLPTWQEIRNAIIPNLDLKELLTNILSSVTSLGSGIFLVVVYAVFLIAERGNVAQKLAVAFPEGNRAERMTRLFNDINRRIAEYLAAKTLINAILGAVSYLIMLAMGLDFAVFWAVLIAVSNYIPYVGTLAILFPIVLSLAQFGSLTTALILAALLALAQFFSDNVLEPKMFSRQLNLSPFVIVVALSVWSALWGLPGAILAIPITSMLAIILAAFPTTRFLAVLLAERVDGLDKPEPPRI